MKPYAILQRPQWIIGLLLISFAWIAFSSSSNQYLRGNLSQIEFSSKHLADSRRVWIYLPPDYENSQEHYAVLYLHDGQNVFDGKTSTHKGIEWWVDETLQEMIPSQQIPGLIVVAIESNAKTPLWKKAVK